MAYPKETTEAAIALIQLAKVIAEVSKDGFQWSDAAVVAQKLSESPLKEKIEAAKEGMDKIPAELKDLGVADAFGVVATLAPEIIELITSLPKKA